MDPIMPVAAAPPAVAVAAPAPAAPTPTTGTEILASLSAADRADYERTGELPETAKPTFVDDKPPASSAAPAVEPPASTDALPKADSEPADNDPDYKPKTKARIDSLLTDNKRLKDELARRPVAAAPPVQTPPAASSPALEVPPEPDGTNYEKYPLGTADPAYVKDVAAHAVAVDRVQRQNEARDASTAQATREAAAELTSRVETYKGKYADFEDVTKGVKGIAPSSMLDAWILSSKSLGFEALYHFGKHPDVLARILAISDPIEQIETVVLLGHSLKEGAAPAPKTKTEAPAPPPLLDTRPNAADNDAEAAMARGDAAAYQRIMNEHEMAGLKKR